MRRARQLSFLPSFKNLNTALKHGGEVNRGRRKLARPVDPKRPIHLVLTSSKARGDWSLTNTDNRRHIREALYQGKKRFGVKVYSQGTQGNHLHLLIKAPSRRDFQDFLRYLAGRLAMKITGARKGRSLARSETKTDSGVRGFWDSLAFTRLVAWGRDFLSVKDYVELNEQEGQLVWSKAESEFLRARRRGEVGPDEPMRLRTSQGISH